MKGKLRPCLRRCFYLFLLGEEKIHVPRGWKTETSARRLSGLVAKDSPFHGQCGAAAQCWVGKRTEQTKCESHMHCAHSGRAWVSALSEVRATPCTWFWAIVVVCFLHLLLVVSVESDSIGTESQKEPGSLRSRQSLHQTTISPNLESRRMCWPRLVL